MKIKATITMEPEVHSHAKRLARSRNTSVSGLIETLILQQQKDSSTSTVDAMIGSAQLKESSDNPDARRTSLEKKYLSK